MDAAKARNVGVLAMVNSTPVWAGTAGNFPGANTPDPTAYANFMGQVATRYGKTISAYEIWNEVNCSCFYDPVSPSSYADLLKAAYPAIKAADPSATVVAAGLGSVFTAGGVTLNPVDYVKQMYAAGAQGYFDAMAFHPYQETLMFSDGAGQVLTPYTQIGNIHDLMVQNGDGSKLIWITEYGVPTNNVSQQTQADYIKNLIDTWQSVSFGGPIFIYTTRDGQPGSGSFGVFDANWVPKEAAFVIAEEILRLQGVGGVEGIAGRVLAALQLAWTAVKNVVSTIGQAVVSAVNWAWNAFVDFAKAVTRAVVNTVKFVTTAVVNISKAVVQGISNVVSGIIDRISNVFQSVGNVLNQPGLAASPAAAKVAAAVKPEAVLVPDAVKAAAAADSPKAADAAKSESGVQGTEAKDAGRPTPESKGTEVKGTEVKSFSKGSVPASSDANVTDAPRTKVHTRQDDSTSTSKTDRPDSNPKTSDSGKKFGRHRDDAAGRSGSGDTTKDAPSNDAPKVRRARRRPLQARPRRGPSRRIHRGRTKPADRPPAAARRFPRRWRSELDVLAHRDSILLNRSNCVESTCNYGN
ncbi:MAG: hypothetical protein P4L86_27700 [Mycobacterium sp.]|nr:hypothetical protein [Mycobacterium sp.]